MNDTRITIYAASWNRVVRERDEARNQRDSLRLAAQKEAEQHDRMVGELERVHADRDEARQLACLYRDQYWLCAQPNSVDMGPPRFSWEVAK